MLVLSRKKNQSIRIGEDIVLTIVDIQGDQIRLGIEAPRGIPVLRQELYEAVKDSNKQAAETLQKMDVTYILKQVQIMGHDIKGK